MAQNNRLQLSLLLASTCLLSGAPALAEPPTADPGEQGVSLRATISEAGTWQSNPLMQTQGAKSLYGSITTPELIITSNTPLTKFNVDTTVNENLFNRSTFNSTDVHSKAGISRQGQTWTLGLSEKTDYDTTRTSELSNFGLSIVPIRHLGVTLSPDLSYAPNAKDKFLLSGSVGRSIYDSSIYTDYNVYTLTPTFSRMFDERNTGTFSVQARRYHATNGVSNTIDSLAPSIGWSSNFSPRWTGKASVGVQTSREYGTSVPAKPWNLDYTFSADITFKGQQDIATFSASRSEYPYGNGTESLLTNFSISDTHALNTRFAVTLGANYQTAGYITESTGSMKTQYGGNSGLTFHATDELDVIANYQYRHETLINIPTAAQDHSAGLSLVYHPYAWSM